MGSEESQADNGPGATDRSATRVECPRCSRVLEFSGARPLFCAFCGKPLPGTIEESTVVPATGPDAPTLAPDPASSSLVIEQPKTVGGYQLLHRLGGGGMGTVYEAEDSSGRHVALKLVGGCEPGSIDTLERFRREGRLASAISHPRCVFVLAADEDAGRPYIVMELMPGKTLADVVREHGHLPPREAVDKILDVIDGLREAHRHGVVHRDVKPSNCFLEADGRVKVGDFGLSKSLSGDSRLTVSGSFLGTPLFASPEQVRGEALGPQSDVYSVAATLYCLLTGRAPFEGGDAASTLARIAADPAPSMRTLRPELPPALDRAVLRGLERDRRRRYRDLDEFREALRPFVPGQHDAAGRSMRFASFLVDLVLLKLIGFVFFLGILATGQISIDTDPVAVHKQAMRQFAAKTALWLAYFVVSESLWACSLGKWLLRLRVVVVPGFDRPGWWRVLLRFSVFYVLISLQEVAFVPWTGSFDYRTREGQEQLRKVSLTLQPLAILGYFVLLSTMRRRNGWRCFHEIVSGTCVIQLPEPVRRRVMARHSITDQLIRPDTLPQRIGPFEVQGALRWDEDVRMLVGEDAGLGRRVLLWLRPRTEVPLGERRRACSRTTRLRWLASGQQDDWQWDAFPAPAGELLVERVAAGEPLRWSEAQPLLEQLTDELVEADDEGTLPLPLSIGQVWIQPDGSAILLDVSLRPQEHESGGEPAAREINLLARVAHLAMEGALPTANRAVCAVVPEHAKLLLDRLCGAEKAFRDAGAFQAALESTRGRPTEVTAARRAAHVVLQTGALSMGLIMMLVGSWLGGLLTLVVLRETPEQFELQLHRLEVASAAELVGTTASSSTLARAAAAYRYQIDLEFCDRVRNELSKGGRLLRTRLESANWVERSAYYTVAEFSDIRKAARPQGQADIAQSDPHAIEKESNLWRSLPLAAWAGETPDDVNAETVVAMIDRGLRIGVLVAIIAWPALWVLSAFVFRGGLAFRIMELSLVRSDGRRAGRLRCAWRSLLIWVVPAAILAGAVLLEGWYQSSADAGTGGPWASWLAEALRWTFLVVLAAYPVLAIRSPERGLQDRLAGTYLVPR
jgi:eukaryotic-like serine/threonine-protein kinase